MQSHDPFCLTTYTIYNIKRASCFSKGIYYPKGCIWEESQFKPPEKGGNQIHLFRDKYNFDNVGNAFQYYIYTYKIETLKVQPILHKSKKINVFESSILLRERTQSFCPRKRQLAKRGIAKGLSTRRVLHKIGDQEILIGCC